MSQKDTVLLPVNFSHTVPCRCWDGKNLWPGHSFPADAAESNQVHRAVPTAIEGRSVGTRQVPVRFTYPLTRNSNIDLKRAGWPDDLSPVTEKPPRPGLEGTEDHVVDFGKLKVLKFTR